MCWYEIVDISLKKLLKSFYELSTGIATDINGSSCILAEVIITNNDFGFIDLILVYDDARLRISIIYNVKELLVVDQVITSFVYESYKSPESWNSSIIVLYATKSFSFFTFKASPKINSI